MAIIKIEIKVRTSAANRFINREIIYLRCDECNIEYVCKSSNSRAKKGKFHFCSKKCSNKSIKSGILHLTQHKSIREKYDGKMFVETDEFKLKRKATNLEKYGVEFAVSCPQVKEKIEKTNLEKYGKKTYTGSEDHKSKLDYKDIADKAWKTKIKNGTCSKSKPEEKLYLILKKEFGEDNVIRQYKVIRQWVDFYIVSIDTYIQVDGVYWHGLNRPLAEIKLMKTRQDEKIYRQILRDKKLNKHMKVNKMKIIRITDDQVNSYSDNDLLKIVKGK